MIRSSGLPSLLGSLCLPNINRMKWVAILIYLISKDTLFQNGRDRKDGLPAALGVVASLIYIECHSWIHRETLSQFSPPHISAPKIPQSTHILGVVTLRDRLDL